MIRKAKFFILFILSIFIFSSTDICKVIAAPVEKNGDKKTIYLTFDDGPSDKITDKVLDILKGNDVKASFFLIGNQIQGRETMVKRIHEEGHSIGLHTYTHEYKKIYSSEEGFIQEMVTSSNEINKVTGIKPTIIRFPGGSRKHLNKIFLDKLHSCNFKIYDWNKQLSDGINPKIPPNKLFREATKEGDEENTIILLMHCDYMHKNTCKALPNIIKYYKGKGYEFKPITAETEELYFPIKK